MPKMKTHSSAKKRFKRTGTGKYKFRHANTSHLMRKRSKRTKTRLCVAGTVDESQVGRVRKLLCE